MNFKNRDDLFLFYCMQIEDLTLTPPEATGLLIVVLQSLFSLFFTWNHSQIQFGISCPTFNGITISGNIKK